MNTDPSASLAHLPNRAVGHALGLDQAPHLPDPDTADAVHLGHNVSLTSKHPNIAFEWGGAEGPTAIVNSRGVGDGTRAPPRTFRRIASTCRLMGPLAPPRSLAANLSIR